MTETELQAELEDMCTGLGLLWHHCGDPRRCRGQRGWVDLVAAGEHGMVFIELKSAGGQTSAAQDLWHWHLYKGGHTVHVFRPGDLALARKLLENIR